MHLVRFFILVVLVLLPIIINTNIISSSKKENKGKLIYIGPTPRLKYEFTPKEWSSLGLELQLIQIRLDSICYTDDWLKSTRKYYKGKFWKERIKNGTKESKAWGIEISENYRGNPVVDFI